MRRLIAIGLLTLSTVQQGVAGPWNPKLEFKLEDASYDETLIFLSGAAYAFAYSTRHLAGHREKNFFCLPQGEVLDARLLVDLLNARLAGPQTADAVVGAAATALAQKYPC